MNDSDRKIILVTRTTRLQELVARYNTVEQARFQAEHLGMDFADFLEEDRIYHAAVSKVESGLAQHGRLQRLDRQFLPNFLFPPQCLVVVLGQDGLVANTLKYLKGQVLLGINPDPARFDGVLLPFSTDDFTKVMPEVLRGKRSIRDITMARAVLNDGQELLAVNDLFIGMRNHVSARYELDFGKQHERQSSSGIIVSTGLGSTGWLRSVLTGAVALVGGKSNQRMQSLREKGFSWEAEKLVFSVREPFPSRASQASMIFGEIEIGNALRVRSQMPEGGIIFSDGMAADGLEFRSGLEASISIAEQRGHLLH